MLDGEAVVTNFTGSPQAELALPIRNSKLWSPDNPHLYGLQVRVFQNGLTNDTVSSYFGMRKIGGQRAHAMVHRQNGFLDFLEFGRQSGFECLRFFEQIQQPGHFLFAHVEVVPPDNGGALPRREGG